MANIFDQFDQPAQGQPAPAQSQPAPATTQSQAAAGGDAIEPDSGRNVPLDMLEGTAAAMMGLRTNDAELVGPVMTFMDMPPDNQEFVDTGDGKLVSIGQFGSDTFTRIDPESGQEILFRRKPVKGAVERALKASSALAPGLASTAPAVASAAAAAGAARAAQNPVVAAATRQGVDVTLPTAVNNRAVRSAASTVREVPFAGPIQERGIAREAGQIAQRAEQTAARASQADDAGQAGASVREGLDTFQETTTAGGREFNLRNAGDAQISSIIAAPSRKSSFSMKASALYERAGRAIPQGAQGTPGRTIETIRQIRERFNNPQLQAQFENSFFGKLESALEGGQQTFRDLRQLRTEVRQLNPDKLTAGERTVQTGELQRLEQALTDDILQLARQAGGEKAVKVLRRADDFYRTGISRIEATKDLLNVKSDEQLFARVVDLASDKRTASIKKLNQVMRSLGNNAASDVAAVAIRNLGKGPAGQADAAIATPAGDFSIGSFVTNYAKLSDKGKTILFNRTGQGDLRSALDDLATIAAGAKRTARFSVPTGGGVAQGRNLTIGGIVTAGFFDAWGAAALTLGGAALAAKFMTSPRIVRGLTRIAQVNVSGGGSAQRLSQIERMRQALKADPNFKDVADQMIDLVMNEGQATAENDQGQ